MQACPAVYNLRQQLDAIVRIRQDIEQLIIYPRFTFEGWKMNKKNVFIGIAMILLGVWFYSALSTFNVEEGDLFDNLIIKEGSVRSMEEVAEALSKEMGFDLEGAYKTGYTSADVIEYLIKEPHRLSVTFHEGDFYVGRKTVPRLIPFAVCIVLIVIGTGMVLVNFKSSPKDRPHPPVSSGKEEERAASLKSNEPSSPPSPGGK